MGGVNWGKMAKFVKGEGGSLPLAGIITKAKSWPRTQASFPSKLATPAILTPADTLKQEVFLLKVTFKNCHTFSRKEGRKELLSWGARRLCLLYTTHLVAQDLWVAFMIFFMTLCYYILPAGSMSLVFDT